MTTATATKPARAGTRRRTAGPGADPAPQLAAVVGPASIEVAPRHLHVGDGYAATLAITGYPPELGLAWLDVVLSWPGRVDLVEHIDPMPAATAAEDAADLADRVARGATRLHHGGHYLCVHAPTQEQLVEAVAEVRAAAASVLLDTQPTTWRQLHGWTSTLPLGVDSLRMRRVFDTDAIAAAFPLASADLPAPLPGDGVPAGGVLYGLNTASNGVVWWDRWS